jgi:hypothetical protein
VERFSCGASTVDTDGNDEEEESGSMKAESLVLAAAEDPKVLLVGGRRKAEAQRCFKILVSKVEAKECQR